MKDATGRRELDGKLFKPRGNKVQCNGNSFDKRPHSSSDYLIPLKVERHGTSFQNHRISPRAIKTAILQDTKRDPNRTNVIQGDLAETKEPKGFCCH